MRLTVSTPVELVLDESEVRSIRAEDASGLFGLLPGHVDLLTVLVPSVLSWRDGGGGEHHVALRGGVLTVRGPQVEVATREAVLGEDLLALEREVLVRFRAEAAAEAEARSQATRWQAAAIRRIARALGPRSLPGSRVVPGEEEA